MKSWVHDVPKYSRPVEFSWERGERKSEVTRMDECVCFLVGELSSFCLKALHFCFYSFDELIEITLFVLCYLTIFLKFFEGLAEARFRSSTKVCLELRVRTVCGPLWL